MGKREKRRHERYNAKQLQGRLAFSMYVDVVNISLSGLAAKTSTPLVIGKRYSIRLSYGSRTSDLVATVRWCRLSGTRRVRPGEVQPVYVAGLAFEDILSDKGEELLDFIEENAPIELNPRLYGRFVLEKPGKTRVRSDLSFRVRQISQSGMLAETEVALKPDSEFELEIELETESFKSLGRLVHVRPAGDDEPPSRYQMGVEFVNPDEAQLEILRKFLGRKLDKASG